MANQPIEHVVLLMLENRSFDSLLGWLYGPDKPAHNIPAAAPGDEYRGLNGLDLKKWANSSSGTTVLPTRGATGFTVPTPAPGEEFEHVNRQFFGTSTPAPGAVATMTGVLEDYADVMHELGYGAADVARRSPEIMQSYTPSQLPVLNQLARHYAVSDAWFASVPTQTNANRAFTLCGTSHGLVNNGELEDPQSTAKFIEDQLHMGVGDDRFPDETIFHALEAAGRDWKVFWQTSYLPEKLGKLLGVAKDIPQSTPNRDGVLGLIQKLLNVPGYLGDLTSGRLESTYTWRLFPKIHDLPDAASKFAHVEEFHAMARAGTLPAFSYVEPFWTISQGGTDDSLRRLVTAMGNDYHPPSNLLVGEAFVQSVYESLIANRDAWAKTMLIITFDEFVGSFDHVTPPAAVSPWGDGPPPYPVKTGFDFKRLGARVPTIVVSPWVEAGTVFRSATDVAFDHTSIIKTTLELFGAGDRVADFHERTKAAPTFDGVLTRTQPRTDERDLAFLDTARAVGDPVGYGDLVALRHDASGLFFGQTERASKIGVLPDALLPVAVDLDIAADYPTLASTKVPLSFINQLDPDATTVAGDDQVWIVSREPDRWADNVLSRWTSPDCFWYDLYLDGSNQAAQVWALQKVDGSDDDLRFGDQVRLVNTGTDEGLSRSVSPKWITTSGTGDTWTVLPYVERG